MFDVAVVIPTLLRPALIRAVESVVAQSLDGRINIVVGVDYPQGSPELLDQLKKLSSDRRRITVLQPGYSTSKARGGFFSNRYGGAMRTIGSFAANAPYVAYLDDDNWFAPQHVETLLEAIRGKHWAFSLRQFVDEDSMQPLGIDTWESVGPGLGVFNERFGGFCDTSTLLLDVAQNMDLLHLWSLSPFADGSGEDRVVFNQLKERPCGQTGQATSYYVMNRSDGMHAQRCQHLQTQGVAVPQPMSLANFCAAIQPTWPPAPDRAALKPLDLQGWGGSNSPAIAQVLRELKPTSLIEVGSWKGASAVFMCQTLLALDIQPHILCVDTWLGGVDHWLQPDLRESLQFRDGLPELARQFISNVLHAGLAQHIVPLPTTSRHAAKLLKAAKVTVDFVYIDAGHEEDDVLEDLRAYWPLLRRGGVLMGDDYKPAVWPGVVRAVGRFALDIGARVIVCGEADYPQFLIQKE